MEVLLLLILIPIVIYFINKLCKSGTAVVAVARINRELIDDLDKAQVIKDNELIAELRKSK
jgi:hypothetical protein